MISTVKYLSSPPPPHTQPTESGLFSCSTMDHNIISVSGGKDSTALLLLAIERDAENEMLREALKDAEVKQGEVK